MTIPRDRPHGGLDQASDEVLADRAADGDTRAFGVLVTRYGRLLRAYATRVLSTSAHSDDVVQDALVTAWQQLEGLEDRSAVRGWLIRIVTRKALDHARASRQHDDVDELDPPEASAAGPEGRVQASSLSAALDAALAALPPVQRQAWTLRELGGYSYDEIAQELGVPPSTVRGALSRARSRLIGELEGWR